MDTTFDQQYRTDLSGELDSNSQDIVSNRLFEDSVGAGGKQPVGAGTAAEARGEAKGGDGKKPPPFEIIDEKDPESKREAAIKDAARDLKHGKFTEESKRLLLEALNTGDTDAARRKSLTDVIDKINMELKKLYKESGEKDPTKLFEVRFQNIRGADGTYDKLRIGLQSRKSTIDYNDSFMIRPKK